MGSQRVGHDWASSLHFTSLHVSYSYRIKKWTEFGAFVAGGMSHTFSLHGPAIELLCSKKKKKKKAKSLKNTFLIEKKLSLMSVFQKLNKILDCLCNVKWERPFVFERPHLVFWVQLWRQFQMFSEKKQQVVINREKLCKEIILFGDTKSSW